MFKRETRERRKCQDIHYCTVFTGKTLQVHKEMIRNRILMGVCNSTLALKLQLKEKVMLDKAVIHTGKAKMINKQQPLVLGAQ